ncbi:MAG: anthranilate synthase component I [Planctomycetota bacterium]
MHSPTLDEFKQLARPGTVVPVYRQLLADTLTPVSAFLRFGQEDDCFLLESVTGGEKIDRYSMMGFGPAAVFSCSEGTVTCRRDGAVDEHASDDPIAEFERLCTRSAPVRVPGLPEQEQSFSGGAVGYFAYDVVRYVEDLPNRPGRSLGLPDLCFMFFDTVIVFDHVFHTVKVISNVHVDEDTDPGAAYGEAVEAIARVVDKLSRSVSLVHDDIVTTGTEEIPFESNFEKPDYLAAVDKCKEYIRAGDIFQVVLSQRLHAKTTADPFDIYRVLRAINPSPYMFYIKLGDLELIGASPEVMVKVDGDRMVVRPIAGTRRRGKDDAEDAALADELINDPKERAEHIMLVDLGRNDVGRVCEFNTVGLDDVMVIEKFSHVMHITSQVSGRLEEGKTCFDALRSAIPAGTLSGAPKIRAMEILDELEPDVRGPYGGAVGYVTYGGNMNTGIIIRTLSLIGEDAYVQAGGGIVADSVPETEYRETLNKARAVLRAVKIAEEQMGQ